MTRIPRATRFPVPGMKTDSAMPLLLFRPFSCKANTPPRKLRKLGQAADLRQDLQEGSIVGGKFAAMPLDLRGELFDARGEVGVRSQRRTHANEGADDQHTDFDSATGSQHAGQHQAPVLSEGEGRPGRIPVLLGTSRKLREVRLTSPCALQCGRILRPHRAPFVRAQPENEVCWKSRLVPAHLLVQPLRLDVIQTRQIRIQHDPLPAQLDDAGGDDFQFRQVVHSRKFGAPSVDRHAANLPNLTEYARY